MLAQPSMIKRPLLDLGGKRLVGFKPEVYAQGGEIQKMKPQRRVEAVLSTGSRRGLCFVARPHGRPKRPEQHAVPASRRIVESAFVSVVISDRMIATRNDKGMQMMAGLRSDTNHHAPSICESCLPRMSTWMVGDR